MYGHHSSSSSRMHYHHRHCHHPYRMSEYLPEELKKFKPPTFDGEMKKSEYAKAWLLGMNKFFRLHNYSESMKSKISTLSLKGKANIWLEDVNNFKGIREEELILDEFERLFKKKYYWRGTMMTKLRNFMSCRWILRQMMSI